MTIVYLTTDFIFVPSNINIYTHKKYIHCIRKLCIQIGQVMLWEKRLLENNFSFSSVILSAGVTGLLNFVAPIFTLEF